jgi:hypothetical protein
MTHSYRASRTPSVFHARLLGLGLGRDQFASSVRRRPQGPAVRARSGHRVGRSRPIEARVGLPRPKIP